MLATTPDGRAGDDEHGDRRRPGDRLWRRDLGLGPPTEVGRLAHRKFWRQSIFWLSHKEDDSENQVKLTVTPRRVAVGEKLELTATARDPKGAPITDATYECKIEREGPDAVTEPVELYNQGDQARATKYATEHLGVPGNYTASVIARRAGKEIGHDSARFLVYQDDRELENPSADLKLAREIAELTGGQLVTPEKLTTHLKTHRPLGLHRVRQRLRIRSLG